MKPNLILIPGLVCDETVWVAQIAALKDVADIHVADHEERDTLGSMAEAILSLAPGPLAIAGHSMGGRIALEVVRRAPERVRGLALLDTGYRAKAAGEAGEQEIAMRQRLLDIARTQGMRQMGRVWLQDIVYTPRLDERELTDSILDMIERKPLSVFEAQNRALLSRQDATQLLTTIRCPTLVLCGDDDRWARPAQHKEMVALIPGQRVRRNTRVRTHVHHGTPRRRQRGAACVAREPDVS